MKQLRKRERESNHPTGPSNDCIDQKCTHSHYLPSIRNVHMHGNTHRETGKNSEDTMHLIHWTPDKFRDSNLLAEYRRILWPGFSVPRARCETHLLNECFIRTNNIDVNIYLNMLNKQYVHRNDYFTSYTTCIAYVRLCRCVEHLLDDRLRASSLSS